MSLFHHPSSNYDLISHAGCKVGKRRCLSWWHAAGRQLVAWKLFILTCLLILFWPCKIKNDRWTKSVENDRVSIRWSLTANLGNKHCAFPMSASQYQVSLWFNSWLFLMWGSSSGNCSLNTALMWLSESNQCTGSLLLTTNSEVLYRKTFTDCKYIELLSL